MRSALAFWILHTAQYSCVPQCLSSTASMQCSTAQRSAGETSGCVFETWLCFSDPAMMLEVVSMDGDWVDIMRLLLRSGMVLG